MANLGKRAPIILAGVISMVFLLAGCSGNASSGEGPQSVPNEGGEASYYAIGDTVSTDEVEFTLTDVAFTDKVSLDSTDWLKPINGTGGLTAGEGNVFVWMSLTAENVSREDVSGYDVTDIVVDYDDGYIYDNATWTDGSYGWSTDSATSRNVGLATIMPLKSAEFYGYVKCASAVREDREKPLNIKVTLPGSGGEEEFVYEYSLSGGADASKEALAVSDAFDAALDELGFVAKYAGNTNANGSRKFADEAIDRLRHSLDSIDAGYVDDNMPQVAAALPGIQSNIGSICDLLVDMGQTNSDANVPQIKSLCSETESSINALLDGELKAFN